MWHTGEKLFFDQGYITFSPALKVVTSDNVKNDTSLYKMLSEYEGQRIIYRIGTPQGNNF